MQLTDKHVTTPCILRVARTDSPMISYTVRCWHHRHHDWCVVTNTLMTTTLVHSCHQWRCANDSKTCFSSHLVISSMNEWSLSTSYYVTCCSVASSSMFIHWFVCYTCCWWFHVHTRIHTFHHHLLFVLCRNDAWFRSTLKRCQKEAFLGLFRIIRFILMMLILTCIVNVFMIMMLFTSHIMLMNSCFFIVISISCKSHLVTKCRKTRISRSDTNSTIRQTRNPSRNRHFSSRTPQLSVQFSSSKKHDEIYVDFWRIPDPFFDRFFAHKIAFDSSFARCSQLFTESTKTSQNLQIWVSQNRYPFPRSFPTQCDADTPISGV
jgi:hypothetical protein